MKSSRIFLACIALIISCQSPKEETTQVPKPILNTDLTEYAQRALSMHESIDPERKTALRSLAEYVRSKGEEGQQARLTFICTHNSRRSHMSQIWAATAAKFFGLEHVQTYSGGTEATAFNPRAVAAMQRAGFAITKPEGTNPRYQLQLEEGAEPMVCFSKRYDDLGNPQEGFAAVMTCSQADEACPIVKGNDFRVAIPYVDPKVSDGTDVEAATYDERCLQIASEMFYVMSLAKK